MKHDLQDQVFFAGTILLAATPISRAARHLATSARAVCALMWIIQSLPERVYAFLSEAGVPNYEVLLVPLYAGQPDPLGTLWVISHDEAIHFDSGDARATTELAAFAGLALKMIQDASALRASEERLSLALHHQEMLTREMSHRVKNLFAIACVREALMLIEHHLVQAAVLDVNLSDRDVTPIAELLIEGGIPVIFYSGLALPVALRERYPSASVYKKPTPPVQLLNKLAALMRK
jgi:hypothetical protein